MAFDPLHTHPNVALSNSNRTATMGGNINDFYGSRTVLAPPGKAYAEIKVVSGSVTPDMLIGLTSADPAPHSSGLSSGWHYYQHTGDKQIGSVNAGAFGAAWDANNDVVGVAYDPAAGKLWFAKNGVWQGSGDPVTGANPAFVGLASGLYLLIQMYRWQSPAHVLTGNFLTEDFQYTAPDGFRPWDSPYIPSISGNATKSAGGAVDQVVIREWTTRALVEIVTPASNGDWTTEINPGQYDITYFAADCQPICHGPYTVTAD